MKVEAKKAMSIFYPKCKKKSLLKKCPLNIVETYVICEKSHSTSSFPSLPRLKVVFHEANEEVD